jgi:probable phosphoglycerate mutase
LTTFLFIRHAAHDFLGKRLAGRMPEVQLNPAGEAQALELARRLADAGLAAVYASPQRRAQETARPIADRVGLTVATFDALDEIDFGRWMGLTFAALEEDAEWHAWNHSRSTARAPGGESMSEAQARVLRGLADLEQAHPAVWWLWLAMQM